MNKNRIWTIPTKLYKEEEIMFVKPPNTFTLNDTEMNNIKWWLEEHIKQCPYFGPKTAKWFGSPIHYIFTPDSTGTSVRIKCNCGAEEDIGDY